MSQATAPNASAFVPPSKRHDTLVGIDSDGCVFDTMDVKQRRHFHPLIVRWWGLELIERQVREVAEHVNLRSRLRGRNRFTNLLVFFEQLAARADVRASGVKLPDLTALRAYCGSGLPLGNATLAAEVARTGDPELERLMGWSLAVNADIDARMAPVPPFEWARRSLERLAGGSDLVVVSQTPEAALLKEWRHHGLDRLVPCIAGQEHGSKSEQLVQANGGRYGDGRVLMIGDAPGDLAAAQSCGALFYPIVPGEEEDSWRRFHDEAYDLFLAGAYDDAYARRRLEDFDRALADGS
ncbi:MAG: HAD family hydrolase [Kiritimatiellae bacterium]|nr:HAD family hydrolase [Kiritimatiellia bacterium]